MALPVYARVAASGTNGKIPASKLVTVPMVGADAQVDTRYARALRALIHDAKVATGLDLGHVGDYRSLQEQIDLLHERYVKCAASDSRRSRYWAGSWWRKVEGATAATPGTSDHGWGLAVDLCWMIKGKPVNIAQHKAGWKWFRENLTRYGLCWAWADEDDEPWHAHLYAVGTAAVLAFERGAPTPPKPTPTPPKPPTYKSPLPSVTSATMLRLGSSGAKVKQLQQQLDYWGKKLYRGGSVAQDGQFGQQTLTALRRMQLHLVAVNRMNAKDVDGIYGPYTYLCWTAYLADIANL